MYWAGRDCGQTQKKLSDGLCVQDKELAQGDKHEHAIAGGVLRTLIPQEVTP
jgi:hypothetical protein